MRAFVSYRHHPCIAIGIYTTLFPVLVSPLSEKEKKERHRSSYVRTAPFESIRCHLQAVVLSELVLLILRQMADETIEVWNHVLVCLKSLKVVSHGCCCFANATRTLWNPSNGLSV